MNDLIIIFLFLIPIIIGSFAALFKPKCFVSWTNKLNDWIVEKRRKIARERNSSSKYIFKPFFWILSKIMDWSKKRFKNEFLRSGVRITLALYFIGFFVFVLVCLAMVVIGVVIGLALFFLILYFISKWAFEEEDLFQTRRGETFFRTAKIDKALFSDDKILKDEMGRKVGILSKAIISDDQIIRDASGNTIGRITQSFWDKDVQIIQTSAGNKIGEIKTDFLGNRVIVDDRGNKIGTIKKNIFGETVIEKD